MTELENHLMTKDQFFIVLEGKNGLALLKGEGTQVYCILEGKKSIMTRFEGLALSQKLLSKGYLVKTVQTTSEEAMAAYLKAQLK